VATITAFLFHSGGHDEPAKLVENVGKSFQGCVVVGMGFTFDNTDGKGVATPLADMYRLTDEAPNSREVIFPYIGGEELNTSPTHAHHRYVINFGERTEDECRQSWPELLAIVEQKVRPEREAALAKSWSKDKEKRAENWWQFSRTAKDLYAAIDGFDQVLIIARTSDSFGFTFLPADRVFSENIVAFAFRTFHAYCVLQSRIHECWARFFSNTLKDDLQYSPSNCFETYPFPKDWETQLGLENAGREYYEFRAALMVRNNEGLTKIYNRFHDPEEADPAVLKLRELHAAVDRAVLDSYGWTDARPKLDFILDYEDEGDEDNSAGRDKTKPWRYRWVDEDRDDILARLLELNHNRAEEEAQSVPKAPVAKTAGRRGRKSIKSAPTASPNLFEVQEPTE
jgi:hypothetical protein